MNYSTIKFAFTFSVVLFFAAAQSRAGDWRQFRGNSANSVAVDEKPPTELSGGSIAWQVELPGRGVASPIAVGESIILTASSGYAQDRLHILSFDSETGETQWERQFQATGRTACVTTRCPSPLRLRRATANAFSRSIRATI